MIRRRIPKRVEISPTSMGMSPPLCMNALDVGPHVQKVRPILRGQVRRVLGASDMRLSAMAELQLRALTAIGTLNQQHD